MYGMRWSPNALKDFSWISSRDSNIYWGGISAAGDISAGIPKPLSWTTLVTYITVVCAFSIQLFIRIIRLQLYLQHSSKLHFTFHAFSDCPTTSKKMTFVPKPICTSAEAPFPLLLLDGNVEAITVLPTGLARGHRVSIDHTSSFPRKLN